MKKKMIVLLGGFNLLCLWLTLATTVTAQEAKPRLTLEGHDKPISCITFHPDGKILGSSSDDGTIKIWDAATGKNTATLKGKPDAGWGLCSLVFSPDGKHLASAIHETEVKLWRVDTLKDTTTLEGGVGRGNGSVIAFSKDSKTVSANSNDLFRSPKIKFWDVASGKYKKEESELLKGNYNMPQSISFSPDGKALAAGTGEGIMLWDLASGERTNLTPKTPFQTGVSFVAFNPKGKTLASPHAAEKGEVRLFDLETRKVIATTGQGHKSAVIALAFSPDGKLIATGSEGDGVVKLWNSANFKEIATLKCPGYIHSVAFSPDSKTIAANSGNTIRLWDVPTLEKK